MMYTFDYLVDDFERRAAGRLDRVVRFRIERLAPGEQRAQIRHRLRMVRHRAAVPLADDAVPVVLGGGAQPHRDRATSPAAHRCRVR